MFRGYGHGYNRVPPRFPKADSYDGGFNFCRGMFTSVRREPSGSGWSTDYPDADVNFSIRFAELTKARVSQQPTGDPNHLVVPLGDDWLFNCPYIHMEDAGTLAVHRARSGARARLPAEGRLHLGRRFVGHVGAGSRGNSRSAACCRRANTRCSTSRPIIRSSDDVPGAEAAADSRRSPIGGAAAAAPRSAASTATCRSFAASAIANGNLMVLMTHNTDISDAWEREGEDPQYFYSFSPDGYALGLNIVLYAMTH